MNKLLIILLFFLIHNCSKPKTVLICGDHICVNNSEANQYFKDNLSIEVKIIDKKKGVDIDLVELNLKSNQKNKKIAIQEKDKTNKTVKVLSSSEISEIKSEIKKKEKKRRLVKKTMNKVNKNNKKIIKKMPDDGGGNVKTGNKSKELFNNDLTKKTNKRDIVDVCTLIDKCAIDEISKFFIKQGSKKKFPEISTRE